MVYNGWVYPKNWETEGDDMYLESPKLLFKDGYYYMTSAEGGTAGPATSHMCVMARSKSIFGPWENSPYNPVVHTYSATDNWWSKPSIRTIFHWLNQSLPSQCVIAFRISVIHHPPITVDIIYQCAMTF